MMTLMTRTHIFLQHHNHPGEPMREVGKYGLVLAGALAGCIIVVFFSRNLGIEEAYISCTTFGFFEYDGARVACTPEGAPKKNVLKVLTRNDEGTDDNAQQGHPPS
jgi:hypothetical protein